MIAPTNKNRTHVGASLDLPEGRSRPTPTIINHKKGRKEDEKLSRKIPRMDK